MNCEARPPSDDIDEQIEQLRTRKAKLEELIALQSDVAKLENNLLVGTAEVAEICRVISEKVCAHFKLPIGTLVFKSRKQCHCVPRHIVFYLVRHFMPSASFSEVGKVFHRDHSTVSFGVNSVLDRIETEKPFAALIEKLSADCAEAISQSSDQSGRQTMERI